MNEISISINPLYKCNFRCDFCYLTQKQLSSATKANLELVDLRLREISEHRLITHVDLYGGEIGLLDSSYMDELLEIIFRYYPGHVNINTNFSMISELNYNDRVYNSISWDYEARQSHELVYDNMKSFERPFSVLMLASPMVLSWQEPKIEMIIEKLNGLANLESFEIKPYSMNQANSFQGTNKEYISFIKKWIEKREKMKFSFTNESSIKKCIDQKYSSWSDNHIYITPHSKFGVLEFDKDDREFFLELDSFSDYEKWCDLEKRRSSQNSYCTKCKYFGNCLSEHVREHEGRDGSCSGFPELLDWYQRQ